jgi:uncharacterized protein (TIRG00374 family)
MAAVSRVARLVVAAALTAYVFWKSHPSEVVAAVVRGRWQPMLVAIALVLVDRALMAYRWLQLLCIVNPEDRPPLWAVMRIFFVSTFVGTFLPANVGGDVVRAYSLSKHRVTTGDAIASVFMDRMLGVASLLLMSLVGLTLARDLIANVTIVAALAAAAAVCTVTLLLVFSSTTDALAAVILRRLPHALAHGGGRLLGSIRQYSGHRGALVSVLGSSLAVQVLRIVQAYFLGRGLGIDAGATAYFAFVPLILLVMLIPVTFNGIGTSQFAFVWFFARAGVPRSPAFALSVLFVALGIVGNLPGGLLYAIGRRHVHDAVAPS